MPTRRSIFNVRRSSLKLRRRRLSIVSLQVERLEDRRLLSTTFTQTNLVSDVPGMAKTTDPNLVNPWGITLGLNSGLWISDNGAGKATTYDGTGQPIPAGSPQVVTIPAPAGGSGTSPPTGVATNAT